jgi:hypothetical protein
VLVLYGNCEKDDLEVYYGETVHIFVERKIIQVFSCGYKEWKSDYNPNNRLKYIDHMVGNVVGTK